MRPSRLVDEAAEAVDGNRDVLIFVRVDPDDDVVALECDARHDC